MVIKFKQRKAQKIDRSLWISLPYEWVAHHKLTKGQRLDVILSKDSETLIVKPVKQKEEPSTPPKFDAVKPATTEQEAKDKKGFGLW